MPRIRTSLSTSLASALCLLTLVCAAAEPFHPAVTSTPIEAALDALRSRFPNQVVVGFEELQDIRPDSEPKVDLGPPNSSLQQVLDQIRRQNHRYRIDLLPGGLVHVYPAQGTADPVHLLNIRLKQFHLPPDRCVKFALENLDWFRGGMVGGYAPELSQFLIKKQRDWYHKHGKEPPGGGLVGGGLGGCVPGETGTAAPVYRNINVRDAMNLMSVRSLKLTRKEVRSDDPSYSGQFQPISWKYRFRRETDADTGLSGVPVFQTF